MKAAKKALLFEACAGLFYADFGHCIGCIFSLMRYSDACYFSGFISPYLDESSGTKT